MSKLLSYKAFLESEYSGRILIFGAGVNAYYLTKNVCEYHREYTIECCVVSNITQNVSQILGIPVRGLDECTNIQSLPIIIGTFEKFHQEIYESLLSKGFTNIYALMSDEYRKIRQDYPDSDADVFFISQKIIRELECVDNYIQQNYSAYLKGKAFHEVHYEEDFRIFREREDFDYRLETLVANLDERSRYEIYQIIHRLNLLCDGGLIQFSKAEREAVEEIHEKFNTTIFNLKNKIICGKYTLPGNVFIETSVFWYKNGISQLKNRNKVGKKAIIDAGAYIGDSALVLSEFFQGDIYCFELEPNNIEKIKKVIEWNGLKNVIPINKAVMDKTGEMEFYVGKADNCDYNSVYQLQAGSYKEEKNRFSCIKIDDFVKERNIQIGLIKADVEGSERQLILGAADTIREQHPVLLISIYHSVEDLFSLKPLIESIYDGYEMSIFRPVLEHSFLEETLLICEPKE